VRAEIARRDRTPRGLRPRACTEAPRTGTGRSHGRLRHRVSQTAPGTRGGTAGDERPWEVGQSRSTEEAAEQGQAAAEAVERRGLAKGNPPEQNAPRAPVPDKRAK
jgi:hypothetical protein